jgi:hypothetical protein
VIAPRTSTAITLVVAFAIVTDVFHLVIDIAVVLSTAQAASRFRPYRTNTLDQSLRYFSL